MQIVLSILCVLAGILLAIPYCLLGMECGAAYDGGLSGSRVSLRLVHDGDLRRRHRAGPSPDDSLQLACRLWQERPSSAAGFSAHLLGVDALQFLAGHSPLKRGSSGKDRLRYSRLAYRHAPLRESALRLRGYPHAAHPPRDDDQCMGSGEERLDTHGASVGANEVPPQSGLPTSNREWSPFFFDFSLNFS